ncbi:MAG: TonB-dependent receptor [Steroidobacteraceae bacterium]
MNRIQSKSSSIARIVSAVLASAAGAAPVTVLAESNDSSGLEEVLVTATRHGETDLQTTPIAVTPIDDKTLSAMVGRDISGVTAYVPNFSAARLAAFNAAAFAIRGVGLTDIIVYLDSPVAVNVDDFVMPSIQTQLLDTFDVERVEVLRGPQGTLFGKNTTGGLVNVTTKRPILGQDSMQVQALYGSFDTYQLQGALNYSPSDTLAFRAAVNYNYSDGYYKNGATYGPTLALNYTGPDTPPVVGGPWNGLTGRGSHENVGGTDILNGRIKALWTPTDNLDILLQYEFVNDKSEAVPSFNGTPKEPGCVPFAAAADGGCTFLWNSLGITQPKGDPIDHMATTNRNDNLMFTKRGQRVDVNGWFLNADWDIGWATVHGNAGYRTQDSSLPNTYTGAVPVSADGTEMSLFDATREDKRDTYQYEVRLANKDDSVVDWVVGGFFQENNAVFCVAQVLGFLDMLGNPPIFNTGDLTPQVLCNKQDATSYAGFGDLTWKATDKLSVGAGLRWTYDERAWTGRNQAFVPVITGGDIWSDFNRPLGLSNFHRADWPGNEPCHAGATPGTLEGVCKDKNDWSEPTYRATVSYQINDDTMTYFKFDRGFKSGGYNDQTGTNGYFVPEFLKPYDPEYANSYELGLKTTFMDDRLRVNTALFYVNYDDAQRSLVSSTCILGTGSTPCGPNGELGTVFQETRFFNAAQMTVQGVEVEANWLVTDGFIVNANASYNDGKYDKFGADTNGDGSIDVDLSGLPITRTPEWKWGINPTYTHEAFGGSITYGANLYYESEQTSYYFAGNNHKYDSKLDAKTLLDLVVTYTAPDDKWFARVYGNNVLDERYQIGSQVVATLWTHEQYGPPANFGVQVGMNFGL